jgi:hypothetical protein
LPDSIILFASVIARKEYSNIILIGIHPSYNEQGQLSVFLIAIYCFLFVYCLYYVLLIFFLLDF